MSETPSGNGIADSTWKKGFVHLTVDADGMVSLWDHDMSEHTEGYLRLPLTQEQMKLIEDTMKKGGHTP